MQSYEIINYILGIFLIVYQIRTNNLDSYIIIIYFLLNIKLYFPYLKRAKILGNEFEFKESINQAGKYAKISKEKYEKDLETNYDFNLDYHDTKDEFKENELLDLDMTKEYLEIDSTLAMAVLRIEIEEKLKKIAQTLEFEHYNTLNIFDIIKKLYQENIIRFEQYKSLEYIIKICNKAVHGERISKTDANKVVWIVEELNTTFSFGYSLNFKPNKNYKENGYNCEWEHCIENMPLHKEGSEKDLKLSCPIYGHECPGKEEKVNECKKRYNNDNYDDEKIDFNDFNFEDIPF